MLYLPIVLTQNTEKLFETLPRVQQNRQRWALIPNVPRLGSLGPVLPPSVTRHIEGRHTHPQCPQCPPGGHHPPAGVGHWTEEQWRWWNWWMQWNYFQMLQDSGESKEGDIFSVENNRNNIYIIFCI